MFPLIPMAASLAGAGAGAGAAGTGIMAGLGSMLGGAGGLGNLFPRLNIGYQGRNFGVNTEFPPRRNIMDILQMAQGQGGGMLNDLLGLQTLQGPRPSQRNPMTLTPTGPSVPYA